MHTLHEATAPAMGTTARVAVVGEDPSLADAALARIAQLEARWSRFRVDSELSRLNAAAGSPCLVSSDTFRLVNALVHAWRQTAGRFDPTMSEAMAALGYAQSWPFHTATGGTDSMPTASPGCAAIELDDRTGMVWMPHGTQLDPGGLGKGLAADIVADELIATGATGVMVDLGGDLRVIGTTATGEPWRIGVEHPADLGATIAVVECTDGGIATTSRGKRHWLLHSMGQVRRVHHVLDPSTQRSAERPWVTATALAPTAAAAEVGATIAFLDGQLEAAPDTLAALLAHDNGRCHALGDHPELFAVLQLA